MILVHSIRWTSCFTGNGCYLYLNAIRLRLGWVVIPVSVPQLWRLAWCLMTLKAKVLFLSVDYRARYGLGRVWCTSATRQPFFNFHSLGIEVQDRYRSGGRTQPPTAYCRCHASCRWISTGAQPGNNKRAYWYCSCLTDWQQRVREFLTFSWQETLEN